MDDLVKAVTATHADKFETKKNFRLVENRLSNLLTLLVMQLSGHERELRRIVCGVIEGSKKLKNPSALLLHVNT